MQNLTGTATVKDWVEVTKNLKIAAYIGEPVEVAQDQQLTREGFEGALKKVSKRVRTSERAGAPS